MCVCFLIRALQVGLNDKSWCIVTFRSDSSQICFIGALKLMPPFTQAASGLPDTYIRFHQFRVNSQLSAHFKHVTPQQKISLDRGCCSNCAACNTTTRRTATPAQTIFLLVRCSGRLQRVSLAKRSAYVLLMQVSLLRYTWVLLEWS